MEAPSALSSPPAVAAIREAQRRRLDALALAHIVEVIGDHYGIDYDSVAATLETFPENVLDFAKTPEGVTALGIAVAQDLSDDLADYPCLLVAIH